MERPDVGGGSFLQIGQALMAELPLSMVLTDPNQDDNPIIYVNRAFETLTGYSASSAIGRNCRFLQNGNTDPVVEKELSPAIVARKPTTVTIDNYHLSGRRFRNRLMIAPVTDTEGEVFAFVGIQAEVMETPAPDGAAVALFDARIAEMQHRVKNHLQMISSLIRMQARADGDPASTYDMFGRRVDALALLYDEFQTPPCDADVRYDVVSAGSYVSRVASTVGSLDGRRNVRMRVDADPVYMRSERAAQVGLLTSEILSNTFKHAFDDRGEGVVNVTLKENGGDRIRLMVEDDGVGLGSVDWPATGNLGARIVRGLVDQLGAELNVVTGRRGTIVTVDLDNPLDTSLDARGRRVLADETGDRAGGEP